MTDAASMRGRAIMLMREALALLDGAGEMRAAVHLQWAHDIAADMPLLIYAGGTDAPEGLDVPAGMTRDAGAGQEDVSGRQGTPQSMPPG